MILKSNIATRSLPILLILITGCKPKYTLTGINTKAESFQVKFFQNFADQSPGSTIAPQLDRDFTIALQDYINNSTNLSLTRNNGELFYEGEIVEYRVSPMSSTANETASQNRLTMGVNVRFHDNTKYNSDFEKRFTFFYDFPSTVLLESIKKQAHKVLFERITKDIFNASLVNW